MNINKREWSRKNMHPLWEYLPIECTRHLEDKSANQLCELLSCDEKLYLLYTKNYPIFDFSLGRI